MTTPKRNLPPDAESWGRYVDEALLVLQKRLGIVRTNLHRATDQGAVAQRTAGEVRVATEAVAGRVEEVSEVVDSKTTNFAQSRRPQDPKHGDTWADPADGNTPYVFVNYGDTPRINRLPNPTFYQNVFGWSAANASVVWDPSRAARVYAAADNARVFTDPLDGGADTEGIGYPWSASIVATYEGTKETVSAVLSMKEINGGKTVTFSEPTPLPAGVPVRLIAEFPERTEDDVRLELTFTGVDNTDTILIDEALVERAGSPGIYFDGNSLGAYWDSEASHWGGVGRWEVVRDKVLQTAIFEAAQGLSDVNDMLEAIDAQDGPEGIAAALSEFLSVDVDPEDIWTVVVTKFLVATEKIITKDVMANGSVTGRTLNVVESVPSGAKFSAQPDGVRIWSAGNTTSNPNILLTIGDGFRIQKNDGTAVAWINPTTGAFHTTGGVITNAEIIGSIFTGGLFRTAATGQRWEITSAGGAANTLKAFSNSGDETAPGGIAVSNDTTLGNRPRIIVETAELQSNPLTRTSFEMGSGKNTPTDGYATFDLFTQRATINAPQGLTLNGPIGNDIRMMQGEGLRLGDLEHRYVSYTTSKPSAARGGEVGAGSLSRDQSAWGTRGLSPTAVSGENLSFTRDGLYTITYTVSLPTAFRPVSGTRSYISITSSSWTVRYRNTLGEEDWGTVTTGPVYVPAGGVVSFPFFLGGAGTYNFTGRITVLRHE